MVALKELVLDTQYGTSTKSNEAGRGQPVLRMNNVTYEGAVDVTDLKWVELSPAETSKMELRRGDILFNRTNSRELVGKTAVWDGPAGFTFAGYLVRVRLRNDRVQPQWVAAFMNSPEGKTMLLHMAKPSINMANISASDLMRLRVPVAPVEHQRRTIALLRQADVVRRKRKEAIALTEELLRSAFLEMFGDIPAKRSQWPFKPLREFLSASSGRSSKTVLSATETDIPVYGGNGVNGWATQALYDEPVVVVGRVGQQCGITRMTEGPAWVTDNAIVVSIERRDLLNPVYLAAALQCSPLRAGVMRLDLPFINQSTILDFPLPLPPLSEQERFAALRKRVLSTQAKLRVSHETSTRLFGALVQRAFRGELSASTGKRQLGMSEAGARDVRT